MADEELRPRIDSGVPPPVFPLPDWRLEVEEQRQREREAAEREHTRDP